ncbi:MAG: MFS transporter [Leucobacter sp.]
MPPTNRSLLLRLAPSIYGPTALFTFGEYAMLPLIPVVAAEMGAGLGLSGVIASAVVVGRLAGNVPASWVVARSGERVAMLLASAVAFIAAGGVAFAPNPALLGLASLLVGFSAAAFALARHSFMTTRVPLSFRARALSLIGGSDRLGRFAGPFLAAGLVALTGTPGSTAWAFAACLVLTALLLWLAPDPERVMPAVAAASGGDAGAGTGRPSRRGGVLAAMREGRAPLARVGSCAAILTGVRAIRDVLLPLWGLSIGMDPTDIALVVAVSGTVDFALFYTSGQVMDRWGRLWAALPATGIMGLSFLVLAFTSELPGAAAWMVACAVAIGVGNGLSAGIVMTLGADLAPQADPASFLAAWRTLSDLGGAVAPLAISAIAAVSMPGAAAVAGALAVAGAVGFVRWIPRYVPGAR